MNSHMLNGYSAPGATVYDPSAAIEPGVGAGAYQYGLAGEPVIHSFLLAPLFELDDEPFSDWVRATRARFAALATQVFEAHAAQADHAGLGAQAIEAAERLVALDPLRETAQRQLLNLLARYRGRDAALAHSEAFESLLRRELGVAPEAETRALIAEIGSARPAGMTPPATVPQEAQPVPDAAGLVSPEPPPPAASRWRHIWRTIPVPVRWAAAGAIVLAAGSLILVRDDGAQGTAPSGPAAASQGWASPVLAGVSADQKWLAAQGLYAVLVLPFTADSTGREAERVLADRLSDDLISDLSRVPAIRVISRQTSRLYRGRPVDAAAVGVELGVRYVVEGHVRYDGSRVTVDVALIDTASRLQVWSERFAPDTESPAGVLDDIARGLARRLQINVVALEERRRMPQRGAGDAEVADLLAKGWGAVIRLTRGDRSGGAEAYFEAVLKREPENVSGMTGLAAYYVQAAAMYLLPDPEPHLQRAETLLKQVIASHPHGALPYFYHGMLEKTRGNSQAALAAFAKVIELNPSYAPAYALIGHVLSRTGRLSEAIEHVRYAIRLSPKDHALGIWSLFAGQIELELGRDDSALEWLTRAVELTPRSPFAQASLAAAYALRGDGQNAARHAGEARRLSPNMTLAQMIERVMGQSENGGEPRRLLDGLRQAFTSPS